MISRASAISSWRILAISDRTSARSMAGFRMSPRSPPVSVATSTAEPSDTYLTMVAAPLLDSSSGCACTAISRSGASLSGNLTPQTAVTGEATGTSMNGPAHLREWPARARGPSTGTTLRLTAGIPGPDRGSEPQARGQSETSGTDCRPLSDQDGNKLEPAWTLTGDDPVPQPC